MIAEFISPADPRWIALLPRLPYDVYHLPEYAVFSGRHELGTPCAFYAESGGQALLIPLLLRPLPAGIGEPSGWKDAASPYGYPGPVATAPLDREWLQQAWQMFGAMARENRILTAFLRLHPLRGIPPEAIPESGTTVHHGDIVYIDLSRTAAQIWNDTSLNHKRNIVKTIEGGFSESIDDWSAYASFATIYRSTMDRVNASAFYFFSDAYFHDLREMLAPHLHLFTIRAPDGAIACGGLFTRTNGIVEYHLSGSASDYRRHAPTKLMLDAVRRWAAASGAAVMNLGGGTGRQGNSLFAFKSGFSSSRAPFHTVRMIFDGPLYAALVRHRRRGNDSADPSAGFFPAYREPSAHEGVSV